MKDKIKREVIEEAGNEFKDKISGIESNDEWMMLHDKYIDKIIDMAIQKTIEWKDKEKMDKIEKAIAYSEIGETLKEEVKQKTAQAIFDDLDKGDRIKGDVKVGKGVWWMDIDDYEELKKKYLGSDKRD